MDRALSSSRSFVRGVPRIPQKWRHGDSNPRHPACKAGALPTELYPHVLMGARTGAGGAEEERLNNALRFLQLNPPGRMERLIKVGAGVSADGHP